MSTNSTIILKIDDKKYQAVYCHYDGYVRHNGVLLYKYYNTFEKVSQLISYGSISSLEANLSKCIFFHRDLGRELTIKNNMDNPYGGNGYSYLFADGVWYLIDYNRWDDITDELYDMGTTKLIDVFRYELDSDHPLLLNNQRREKIKRLGITQKV